MEMNSLGIFAFLGLLAGIWARINVLRPPCDSPEVEEAALVAQEYLNAQHTHGYKYALNRIEDIKIHITPTGDSIYVLEIDLLETDCHVLDPTPVVNCTVRPKIFTAVEGDCDVVLKKVHGALAVTAFKCKTEESREDMCRGCHTLLPLNDTVALNFVSASLATLNKDVNKTYSILEVGRMLSQVVSGGPLYTAEYVISEANCTDGVCVPLNDAMAERGLCTARGSNTAHTVNCKMFPTLMPVVDANRTAPLPPKVHGGSLPHTHGLKHHKLTTIHNPDLSTLLSSESKESAEIVPVAPAAVDAAAAADPAPAAEPAPAADPAPAAELAPAADPAPAADTAFDSDRSIYIPPHFMFKREVHGTPAADASPSKGPHSNKGLVSPMPLCPGRVRFFK